MNVLYIVLVLPTTIKHTIKGRSRTESMDTSVRSLNAEHLIASINIHFDYKYVYYVEYTEVFSQWLYLNQGTLLDCTSRKREQRMPWADFTL